MVVDLAIHRERKRAIFGQQGLRAASRVDDGQALVHQDRAGVDIHAAPVRATVTQSLRTFQRLPAQCLQIVTGLQAENTEDGTHGNTPDETAGVGGR